jgi:monothiol glutaredoxin
MTNLRNVKEEIEGIVKNNRVVLFMKGTMEQPKCGFSQRAASILRLYVENVYTVDVLEDDVIREGIKAYSEWPTIPQVYVNGSFIGGSDILLDMHENGELKKVMA